MVDKYIKMCKEFPIKNENIFYLDSGSCHFSLYHLAQMEYNIHENTSYNILIVGKYCNQDIQYWDLGSTVSCFFIKSIEKYSSNKIAKDEAYLLEFDEDDNLLQIKKFIRDNKGE